MRRSIAISIAITTVVGLGILYALGCFDVDYWTHEHPLTQPIQVLSVHGGIISLKDGRTYTPAGVERKPEVSSNEFDDALRVMIGHGVEVTRDLGDGRAFLLVEPLFYNWCGTRDAMGRRWAGGSFQCPLSETMIIAGYARVKLDELELSEHGSWRLLGTKFFQYKHDHYRISATTNAFEYDPNVHYFFDYDRILSIMDDKFKEHQSKCSRCQIDSPNK